jgi:cytochrome b involved in lipid metabolism
MGGIWVAGWLDTTSTPSIAPTHSDIVEVERFTWDEIAPHSGSGSCWLVIDGRVYDVTAYVGEHPADPDTILRYCGKDSTEPFDTKDRGRPHSDHARRLLERYRIGEVAAD